MGGTFGKDMREVPPSAKRVAIASDAAYAAAAEDALRRTAGVLGSWFRKYPAAN